MKAPLTASPSLEEISNAIGPTWLRRIPSVGGGLAVVLFFFPWILVSCGADPDVGIGASGYEMASGNYGELRGVSDLASFFGEVGSDEISADATPLLWLIPIFGLLGLAALSGGRSGVQLSLIGGLLGMAGLLIFAIAIQTEGDELSLVGFNIKYRAGYWGSWLAFFLQAVAAAFTLRFGSFEGAVVETHPGARASPVRPTKEPVVDVRAPPQPRPTVGVLASLEFIEGPMRGQSQSITSTDVMIGRSSACDIRLEDRSVSRVHARLRYAQGTWFIQDQGSSGGIYLNNIQIKASRLKTGDQINLGETSIVFRNRER